MMTNEKDMCLSEIQRVNKPFPKDGHTMAYYYDQELLSFYNISTKTSGQDFFTRGFIKRMCRSLNQLVSRQKIEELNIKMEFDQVDSTKALVCRFSLPVDLVQRKRAIDFLYYKIFLINEDFVGKIICNRAYFIMISFCLK